MEQRQKCREQAPYLLRSPLLAWRPAEALPVWIVGTAVVLMVTASSAQMSIVWHRLHENGGSLLLGENPVALPALPINPWGKVYLRSEVMEVHSVERAAK